jgi:hypothetical protein
MFLKQGGLFRKNCSLNGYDLQIADCNFHASEFIIFMYERIETLLDEHANLVTGLCFLYRLQLL